MIEDIKTVATLCGIQAVVTNSKEAIETQLNNITRESDSPIMLISWDIKTKLSFADSGFPTNPSTHIVGMLVRKPADMTKDEAELASNEMKALFENFIQKLYSQIIPYQTQSTNPCLQNVSYTNIPRYGMGKHSGVLFEFDMLTYIQYECG